MIRRTAKSISPFPNLLLDFCRVGQIKSSIDFGGSDRVIRSICCPPEGSSLVSRHLARYGSLTNHWPQLHHKCMLLVKTLLVASEVTIASKAPRRSNLTSFEVSDLYYNCCYVSLASNCFNFTNQTRRRKNSVVVLQSSDLLIQSSSFFNESRPTTAYMACLREAPRRNVFGREKRRGHRFWSQIVTFIPLPSPQFRQKIEDAASQIDGTISQVGLESPVVGSDHLPETNAGCVGKAAHLGNTPYYL